MAKRKRIVMFSGGAGSWATAKRVAEKHGTENLILLFADTLIEDEDLYRFLIESSFNVFGIEKDEALIKRCQKIPTLEGGDLDTRKKILQRIRRATMKQLPGLQWLAEGRTPWEVFFDVRFLGNSRIDPCSRILKRQFLRKWIEDNHTADEAAVYIGYDWTEANRYEKAQRFWKPWPCFSPMMGLPLMSKAEVLEWLEAEGIKPPRLYEMGFPHNNCGGLCVKAGQANFKLLLENFPERYQYHENKEKSLQLYLGKDVTIMRKMRNKVYNRYPMEELRTDVEEGKPIDEYEWGGCACFSPSDDELPEEAA